MKAKPIHETDNDEHKREPSENAAGETVGDSTAVMVQPIHEPDGDEPKLEPREKAFDATTSDDPFDPKRLRVSSDFGANLGGGSVKKQRNIVPVRKPDRRWFVRVHPTVKIDATTMDDEDGRKFLVLPEIAEQISELIKTERLYLAISRQDIAFFWPVKLPDVDGRIDTWNESAVLIAEQAMREWVRVISNRPLQAYESAALAIELPDPVWPEEPLKALLRIAFRGRLIESVDHPLIKRLRGEI